MINGWTEALIEKVVIMCATVASHARVRRLAAAPPIRNQAVTPGRRAAPGERGAVTLAHQRADGPERGGQQQGRDRRRHKRDQQRRIAPDRSRQVDFGGPVARPPQDDLAAGDLGGEHLLAADLAPDEGGDLLEHRRPTIGLQGGGCRDVAGTVGCHLGLGEEREQRQEGAWLPLGSPTNRSANSLSRCAGVSEAKSPPARVQTAVDRTRMALFMPLSERLIATRHGR